MTDVKRLLDEAWYDLLADALASDGPISDADVKGAVNRARPKIEKLFAAHYEAAVDALERLLNYHDDLFADCGESTAARAAVRRLRGET